MCPGVGQCHSEICDLDSHFYSSFPIDVQYLPDLTSRSIPQSNETLQLAWAGTSAHPSAPIGMSVKGGDASSVPGPSAQGEAAGGRLKVTWVPDQLCANVLRIGKHVVMQRGEIDRGGGGQVSAVMGREDDPGR